LKYALGGVLLYVAASSMLVFLATQTLSSTMWITMFWLILLFSAVNALAKSFMLDAGERQIYHYQLSSPSKVLLAKLIYNFLLLLLMSAVTLFTFILFFGSPIQNFGLFSIVFILGVLSFSILFTVMSSIAVQSGGSSVIMPIISFPVSVPMFVLLLKLSRAAVTNEGVLNYSRDVGSLLAINAVILAVAFLLFPYIWRD